MKKLLSSTARWAVSHRRILTLKVAVAVALAVAHYYPDAKLSLVVNLAWLTLF